MKPISQIKFNATQLPLRALKKAEIDLLTANDCDSSDWKGVKITDKTDLTRIRNCYFAGEINIGVINEDRGLFNAKIQNCSIGDNCYIKNIGIRLSNCNIGSNVTIENTASIEFSPACSCGIGFKISALDETGSRPVMIYPGLSAQIAALSALYPEWAEEKLFPMIQKLIRTNFRNTNFIGNNATIQNCGFIKDVFIFNDVTIAGALRLQNGSVINNSSAETLAHIGSGVDAENFIIEDGTVSGSSLLRNAYVGQGAVLDKGFSAHDSLFFSNCKCENGESAALLAGPYTVTMHKSTLLISSMTSFMNAGSGTNQSNHMYKFAPVHCGIMERGVKTSSNAYIMWGGKIGAFSLLLGNHKKHPDSSDLPFSFLIGDERGDTMLIPAAMLQNCGLRRDEKKWPARDKRLHGKMKLNDRIGFEILNPMTIGKILNGIAILKDLIEKSPFEEERFFYKRMRLYKNHVERALMLYDLAICKYVYDKIYVQKLNFETFYDAHDEWVDLCGQVLPKNFVNRTMEAENLSEMNRILDQAFQNYKEYELSWIAYALKSYVGLREDILCEKAARLDEIFERDEEKYRRLLEDENNILSL